MEHNINKNAMDILIVADDYYSLLAAVAITSIRENMNLCDEIIVHVLDMGMSYEHKSKIKTLENDNFSIIIYDAKIVVEQLVSMNFPKYKNGYAAYGRLFFTEFISKDIHRLLYIDCDVMVCQSLSDMFMIDLNDYAVAGVQDLITIEYQNNIGFSKTERYICSGVMLINVDNWKKKNLIYEAKKLFEKGLKPAYADQDIINLIFCGEIKVLPYKYGKFNSIDERNFDFILTQTGRKNTIAEYPFYKEDEIMNIKNPVILHLRTQPWKKNVTCKETKEWFYYLEKSGFYDEFIPYPADITIKSFIFRKIVIKVIPTKFKLNILAKRLHYKYGKALLKNYGIH